MYVHTYIVLHCCIHTYMYMYVLKLLHPSGSIKQEETTFLLNQVEIDYQVCITFDGYGMYCVMSCTPHVALPYHGPYYLPI